MDNSISLPTNQEIVDKYLDHYRHSKDSVKNRKSAINYFINPQYFGYDKHFFDITTDKLIDYFDYLKHQRNYGLTTKKNKWTLLVSFLNFTMEYYHKYNFIVPIPKKTINWNGIQHKESNSNKDVIITNEELVQILNFMKLRNLKYYLMFRLLAECGMRRRELINLDYDNIDLNKRMIKSYGKTGKVVYYLSKNITKYLVIYLNERKQRKVNTKALFLSSHGKRHNGRFFNIYLKNVLKELEIEKSITTHSFRRSLNTHRKLMNCSAEDRKILLNHKTGDVNFESYVKLSYLQFLTLRDKYDPYQNLQL